MILTLSVCKIDHKVSSHKQEIKTFTEERELACWGCLNAFYIISIYNYGLEIYSVSWNKFLKREKFFLNKSHFDEIDGDLIVLKEGYATLGTACVVLYMKSTRGPIRYGWNSRAKFWRDSHSEQNYTREKFFFHRNGISQSLINVILLPSKDWKEKGKKVTNLKLIQSHKWRFFHHVLREGQ